MNVWAYRRKLLITGIIILVLAAISFFVFWKYWYKAPNCFDGVQNGSEAGIDCGGACEVVCSDSVLKPIVMWDPRLFEISTGVWSVLVYVENPNINIDAVYVPYKFTIYDESGKVLTERSGATILPKNKTVGIFEGSITSGGKIPKRATFEIGDGISWNKNEETEDNLEITHGALLDSDSKPKVEADVKNTGTKEIKNIELVVTIFDGSDNAIAASRTFVESLKKNQNADIFFTWLKPFKLDSRVCEKSSDVVLLLDRSGSMASGGSNPPQPLTDAKSAAVSFISQLTAKDKIGVFSFATHSKNPAESSLTSDFSAAEQSVGTIAIESGNTQYTNIYDVIHSAWQELISGRAQSGAGKIIILLTDGVANNPANPKGGTEEDDIKYAEELALKEAANAKADGLTIYAIGLGDKVNETFLKQVASKESDYFFAPTAADLQSIYESISYDICNEIPARIEITYKIFGDLI